MSEAWEGIFRPLLGLTFTLSPFSVSHFLREKVKARVGEGWGRGKLGITKAPGRKCL